MCYQNKRNKVINKKYIIVFVVFITIIIGFVLIVVYSNNNRKEITVIYPLKTCNFTNSLTETYKAIKSFTKCKNKLSAYNFENKNGYITLYNYVISTKRFDCEESVTYATHADYSFLDNLKPLSERWNGPISLAIHAPGTDFGKTVDSIVYLRNCVDLIKELVTFHLYFLEEHSPSQIPPPSSILNMTYNCSLHPPFSNVNRRDMYVTQNNLTYPINVGRNIARSMSETYFILTSDIELYPNPNLISEFLKLVAACKNSIIEYEPTVFVLPIFEIQKGVALPSNKTDLVNLLTSGKVIPFHQKICAVCHTIPLFGEWKNSEQTDELQVFNNGKRTGAFYHWEPIYIGTQNEPEYDSRLTWEGMKDKVVQGYELCLMNYTFSVLNNAFLIHKPGIKVYNQEKNKWRKKFIDINDKLITTVIIPEIKKKHKDMKECRL